jgi:hypothetical protein
MVIETNICKGKVKTCTPLEQQAIWNLWGYVTLPKIRALFGVLLNMGLALDMFLKRANSIY